MNRWQYALTKEEEALVCRIGFERQLPMLGQPHRNRNYSEGDVWESLQHMITAGSELALARMLGMYDYTPDVNTFKSKSDIPGYEVRYSFSSTYGASLRFRAGVDNPESIYVLLTHGLEFKTRRSPDNEWKGTPYEAVGWAYGHQVMQEEYRYKDTKSYFMPVREIYPMEVLPHA